MTLYGMEYPFGYFRSSVLAMLLLVPLLHPRPWEPEQSSPQCKHTLGTTKTSVSYQRCTRAVSSKHSTVLATKKQINSIPAENKILV